jgi:hypothetical protein
MQQITLPSTMLSQLRQLAFQENRTVDDLVQDAVQEHLELRADAKIDHEITAFEQQHETLMEHYLGQFVAMHQGQVIDADPELEPLFLRVQNKLPDTPILFRLVSEQVETVFRGRALSIVTNE